MDLFTYQLVDDVAERTRRPEHDAYCTQCRGGAHAATDACAAACDLCGSTGPLRVAGGRHHCLAGACLGAGAPPLDVEPVPTRRGRWGSRGDRTLPAFVVGYEASMEGASFLGRYPSEDHARADAERRYAERARRAGSTARLLHQPPSTARRRRAPLEAAS